jgi:hypothetical protein
LRRANHFAYLRPLDFRGTGLFEPDNVPKQSEVSTPAISFGGRTPETGATSKVFQQQTAASKVPTDLRSERRLR